MRNITKTKRQQNQGFSLFTVLIAVSFVGILGLLVLYIALANFNMKVTDLKGKDSFYTAERALEEIRTGLQEDVGNAMSKAYTQVLETYNKENRSQDSSMDRQRQSDFQDRFIKELMRTLRASQTTDNIYSLDDREAEDRIYTAKVSVYKAGAAAKNFPDSDLVVTLDGAKED